MGWISFSSHLIYNKQSSACVVESGHTFWASWIVVAAVSNDDRELRIQQHDVKNYSYDTTIFTIGVSKSHTNRNLVSTNKWRTYFNTICSYSIRLSMETWSLRLYLITVSPSLSGSMTGCKFGWFTTQVLKSCITVASASIRFGLPYKWASGARSFRSSVY